MTAGIQRARYFHEVLDTAVTPRYDNKRKETSRYDNEWQEASREQVSGVMKVVVIAGL